jgi:hypothetical protein
MPEFIVLGTGPAGLFAADWISRNIDPDVVAVGGGLMGALHPMEIGSRSITVLPVFPQRGQGFPEIGCVGPDLAVAYAGTGEIPVRSKAPATRSFAARALHDFSPVSLSLAWKQFGPRIWHEPLLEVQRKIESSYSTTPASRPSRIGYICGESPYAHELRHVIRRVRCINAATTAISDDRIVLFDNHTPLPYRRIVNTLPLPAIARILKLPNPTVAFAGVSFIVASITANEPSRLIYDMALESPIFRVLTPCPDIAIVQLSVPSRRQSWDLKDRLEHLLGGKVISFYPTPFNYPQAYPLEPFAGPTADIVNTACAAYGITNLGRFAEWRYIDLHEISWKERLGCA